MARYTGMEIDAFQPDNLIAGHYPPAITKIFDLEETGVIQRGTVLSREEDGKYAVLGTGKGTASVIVAVPPDEEDTMVEAYICGNFYRNSLVFADDYELTEEDENNLRTVGIVLYDGI